MKKRRNNDGRQSTLFGIWGSKNNSNRDEKSESLGTKRSRSPAQRTSPSLAPPQRLRGRNSRRENVSLPNGPMLLLRGCIGGNNTSERRLTRESLACMPNWNGNVTFKIYGKECQMRRRICQFSAGGELSYSYSGLKNVVAPEFPQILRDIKCQVEGLLCDHILDMVENDSLKSEKNLSISPDFIELVKSTKSSKDAKNEIYNYCLLNHYRNGEEYMGYHSDDEATLDLSTPIASVSLGITRHFDIRPRKKNSSNNRSRVARIALGDGDLLLMFFPMQNHFEHSVPVEKRIRGERINLTFRRIITSHKG